MTILVTGARGNLARRVIDNLLAAGEKVRAASRDPDATRLPDGVETRLIDFSRPETLQQALSGVDKVFLYAATEGIDDFLATARRAEVSKVVLLSSGAAGSPDAETSAIGKSHLAVERAIDAVGLPRVFVRPAMFATNSLWWRDSIVNEGVVRVAYPDSRVNPIHDFDIADVATIGLTSTAIDGQAVSIDGPGFLTQREQVRLIAEAIGKDIAVEELPPEAAAAYLPAELVQMLAADEATRWGPTSEPVTGRPARTFAQWAKDHADDFR